MKLVIAVYRRALGFYHDEFIGYVGIPKEEIIENNDDNITIKVHGIWDISFFGYHENNGYHVMNGDWFGKKDIIPYNHETKHLLGTTNEKPEKYV